MGEINWGVRNEYSYGDLEKLRGHEIDSSNNVVNDVRKHTLENEGGETYPATCKDLEARDARYDAQHVAWRG